MASRAAFIRGVNVGGHNRLPMAAFRATLAGAGFTAVSTYIQSGNVVYDPPPRSGDDAALIAALIERDFGFAPAVVSLGVDELAHHLAANPFPGEDPATTFLAFVAGDPAGLGDLAAWAAPGEAVAVTGGVVHLSCPHGLGRSKLAARCAGSRNPPTTTRNRRTVEAVLRLAGA